MPVKLRLQRKGRKKKPFYHIVAADIRAPRDGKYIERLGYYDPLKTPAFIELLADEDGEDKWLAYKWIKKGAQPTDTVRAILKFKGVYYYKHLMRGVEKGAFDKEKALEMFEEWISKKQEKVEERKAKQKDLLEARRKKIFGVAPAKPVEEEEEEETVAETAVDEGAEDKKEDSNEEKAEAKEEAKKEEAPAKDEKKEEKAEKEEKPAKEEKKAEKKDEKKEEKKED